MQHQSSPFPNVASIPDPIFSPPVLNQSDSNKNLTPTASPQPIPASLKKKINSAAKRVELKTCIGNYQPNPAFSNSIEYPKPGNVFNRSLDLSDTSFPSLGGGNKTNDSQNFLQNNSETSNNFDQSNKFKDTPNNKVTPIKFLQNPLSPDCFTHDISPIKCDTLWDKMHQGKFQTK